MLALLEWWNTWISGGLVPLALAGIGGYFLFVLRRIWLHPRALLGRMRQAGRRGENSPWRALSLALAGVLGVGNLVGVAGAILYGGPGAIFWMWISAALAMLLKYAEIVLALRHRRRTDRGWEGSAMYYIEDSFSSPLRSSSRLSHAAVRQSRRGKRLAGVFAVLLMIDAVCMGCMIQVRAVSSALEARLGVSPLTVGVGLSVVLLTVGLGERGRMARAAEHLVPWMSLGFCVLALVGIARCGARVPQVLAMIVHQGIAPDGDGIRGVVSGSGAFFMLRAIRYGTMRGLLSNEAGCGTSPMAHAGADTGDAVAQGGMGMLEVVLDTHLLCTMTALVILLAFPDGQFPSADPMMVTILAFERLLGRAAGYFLCAAVFCFGLATILCWSHYALQTGAYLFPTEKRRRAQRRDRILLLLYSAFALVGAIGAPEAVWQLSDFAIGGMTGINLFVLLRSRREIVQAGRADHRDR